MYLLKHLYIEITDLIENLQCEIVCNYIYLLPRAYATITEGQ